MTEVASQTGQVTVQKVSFPHGIFATDFQAWRP
jgi:hypothetical protein